MDDFLTEADVRVLGALIEKEITTPDAYPLSLNALTAACNQTSNRYPVVSFDDETVVAAVHRLRRQSLVRGIQRADSRVTKYQHLAAEAMGLSVHELAAMCVLLLRGPQTVGEIRTRTERLAHFDSLSHVEATLDALITRASMPLVTRLTRQAGQKEVRFAHLLSGDAVIDAPVTPASATSEPTSEPTTDRVDALETAMTELRNDVADLKRQLDAFRTQFE